MKSIQLAVLGLVIVTALVCGCRTPLKANPKVESQERISEVRRRAKEIIIPTINFKDATLEEVARYLTEQSVKCSPDGTGIKVWVQQIRQTPSPLKLSAGIDSTLREEIRRIYATCLRDDDCTRQQSCGLITISVRNVPIMEAVIYASALGRVRYRVHEDGIELGCTQIEARLYKLLTPLPNDDFGASPCYHEFRRMLSSAGIPGRFGFLPEGQLIILYGPVEIIDDCESILKRTLNVQPL